MWTLEGVAIVCQLEQGLRLDGVNGSNETFRGWDGTQGGDGEEI